MQSFTCASHRSHKPVQHAFLAGLVEVDGQLVAFDGRDVAIAEFLVEDAVADAEGRGLVGDGFGDQFAVDGAALYAGAAGAVARVGLAIADALDLMAGARAPVAVGRFRAVGLRALPAGRRIGVGEGAGFFGVGADTVETRGAVRILAAATAGGEGAAAIGVAVAAIGIAAFGDLDMDDNRSA